jgi:AcrR family transcriptional regulator
MAVVNVETQLVAADAGPQMPASRHYRKARHDRGAETRQRLLLAALDAFGRYGYEAASTRDIAKRAGANLAAIVYHFGGKEALHQAVAAYVIEQMDCKSDPKIDEAVAALSGPADKRKARVLLQQLMERHIALMLGDPEADLWGRFIMREQMEPSSAFDLIYEHMSQPHQTAVRLVGILLDIDPASDEAMFRVYALTGQVILFRVGEPIVLRRLGRDSLGDKNIALITRIITENIDNMVGIGLADATQEPLRILKSVSA